MSESMKFPSRLVHGQFVKYISKSEIKGIVASLGNSLCEKFKHQELVIICVLKGSMVFLADVVRELHNVRVYIDFVSVKSVGKDSESHGTFFMDKDLSVNIHDKNVLIVEEVIDSGRSLFYLKKRIELAHPRSLSIMTLFDKPHKRLVPIKPDLVGQTLPDHFIIGYGLDLEDYGRNLEDVYFLKYPN